VSPGVAAIVVEAHRRQCDTTPAMDERHVFVVDVSYTRTMGPNLQGLVDEVSRLLGAPATLEDRSFHLLAFGPQSPTVDAVRQSSILQRESPTQVRAWFEQFGITTSTGPVRTPASPERGIGARLCLPARCAGVTYGYLWLLDEDLAGGEHDLGTAMDLAAQAGRLLARGAREQQTREDRLVDLFGDDRAAAERAAADLVDDGLLWPGERVAVVAVRSVGRLDSEREPVDVRLGRLHGSVLTVALRGHSALLVPLRETTGLAPAREAALTVLGEQPSAVAGIGGTSRDLNALHRCWAEARLAARVAAAVPSRGPVAEWGSLGAYRLLGAAPEAALSAAVVDDAVRALLDDPDERLATTARKYLELAGSAKDTAAVLQIHRQTLYYRLHRIEQVTGLDLTSGEDRLRLHLGLLFGSLVGSEQRAG